MNVLDLGAAPGSWAMYAAQKVGRAGHVSAVDLEPLSTALPPGNTVFLQGDALSLENEKLALFAPYDVVLSDMAPRTTGNRLTDSGAKLRALPEGGRRCSYAREGRRAFVGKIFMSNDFRKPEQKPRKHYAAERLVRPEGTRAGSMEVFVVGLEKRR